jgi:hypothetical protein
LRPAGLDVGQDRFARGGEVAHLLRDAGAPLGQADVAELANGALHRV